MFLQRSNGTVLGTTIKLFLGSEKLLLALSCWLLPQPRSVRLSQERKAKSDLLPPVMCEGLIGFRHAMNIFLLFDGRTFSIGGVQQLITQLVDHPSLGPAPRIR